MTSKRNYPLLLAGQFLGAFGDNFLLKALLGPLTYQLLDHQITEQQVSALNSRFSAVFFVPFILLAPLAGWLNDRMPKTSWLFGGNLIKVIGTVIGLAGALLHRSDFHASLAWQTIGYAVVGIGACVYSPAKYGILPEIVPPDRLVKANGTVEMLTLVAIVGGIGGGAALYDHVRSLPLVYVVSLLLYVAALVLNGLMLRTPHNPAATLGHSLREFGGSLASLVRHPRLGRILLGSGLFWFAGSILRSNMQGWGLEVFQTAGLAAESISNVKLNLLLLALTSGIVGGSLLAGQLHRVGDLRWTRRYGFFVAVGVAMLGLLGGRFGLVPAVAGLVVTGLFSGLLLVPLNAALQHESDPTKLGKTIAIQNFTDYFAMLFGAGFLFALAQFGLAPTSVFVALAATLAVIALALRTPALRSSVPSS
ncbi:MAG TPA: MFS transporter [Candidatus Didemnitutus sp.]|nr:MFS transporter [Candidatus Didemnitutus sp.]